MSITDSVIAYYEHTEKDYRVLWGGRALHFGYYGDGVRGHDEALDNANRVLADRVGLRPDERVLDAGCGVGGTSIWLASHRGARVTGVTLVARQVEAARRAARRAGVSSRVDFLEASYTATPLLAGGYDVVLALESLCHAPDKRAFYVEASRLLRPGGRIVVAEYVRQRRDLDYASNQVLREFCLGWQMPDLDTRDEHVSYLEASGFTDVQVEDATERVRPSLKRLHRMAMVSRVGETMLHMAGLRTDVQHANLVGAFRQWDALCRGLWFYGILSARRL